MLRTLHARIRASSSGPSAGLRTIHLNQKRNIVRLAPRTPGEGGADSSSECSSSGGGGADLEGSAPQMEPALASFAAAIQGRRFMCTQCGKWWVSSPADASASAGGP
jgi:hypothetical protein